MTTCARQIECELKKEINGKPEAVFPMLCPVLEEKWIPGWEYNLLHSKSGVNETGCIFRETISGTHYFEEPVPATWTTIHHDTAGREVEFIIHYGDRAIARSSVTVSATDEGFSAVHWRKLLMLIDPVTQRFSNKELEQKVMESLTFIAESLAGYFESGDKS